MGRKREEFSPGTLDQSILLLFLTLAGIGLVQDYSSSFIFATESRGDGLFFFKKQLLVIAISFIFLIGVAYFPFKWIEKLAPFFWIANVILILFTLTPGLGIRAGGASRWLPMPLGFRLQPSELLRITLPLFFAYMMTVDREKFGQWKWPALISFFGLPLLLLLKQPDFGSFAILLLVLVTMLIAFGLPWKYILASGGGMAVGFFLLIWSVPYRKARLMSYLDPWSEGAQSGFQLIQSLLGFRSGGLTGVGLGQGQAKLLFLPEAHTDFTLAVLAEEMGFIGLFLVLSLFGFLIYRGFQISLRANTEFEKATVLGLILSFTFSVFVNVGVALGLLPTKGLALPFLSYGGSSIIVLGILFGLILNIRRRIKVWNKK
jgi:cell division protein FtsW